MTDAADTPLATFVVALVESGDLLHQILARMEAYAGGDPGAAPPDEVLAYLLHDLLEDDLSGFAGEDLLTAAAALTRAADAMEPGLFFVAPPSREPCEGRARRGRRR
jgi:hypothetical protein